MYKPMNHVMLCVILNLIKKRLLCMLLLKFGLSGRLRELKNKEKKLISNSQIGRGRLREWSLARAFNGNLIGVSQCWS